ncbi:FGGY-family carbohydrate kinase [Olivibacter domesticus]|uniref:Sugar (Pentulose or hexulose) kinase n=1 Tax=Olivibacter domesticus TaxID=407022 RepID=A0A1H7Z899_OLID1|nr:FGGY family carbohydrate kinase [Olivibacter domesticus]SEM54461.1 Sugar (pentulose or hexulose) kinase [Olivibacter domesticus]
MKIPVIAVFDVGKTNKKLFLFDEHYRIVFERSARFTETVDEDGDSCENLASLRLSVFDSLHEVFRRDEFEIKAINFSTYGASFVYIDESGKPLTPLYNYLKAYPEALKDKFYSKYGGEENFALQTASPVLGSLNSGMQLYRLKHEKPAVFKQVYKALHLPQYMSFLISGKVYSDLTSIGCHTNLWDFQKNDYHEWVKQEGILEKLAPIVPADSVFQASFPGNNYAVGAGFHDSSAALIPYLVSFTKPFVLLSTGTWCISLNPFNEEALTSEDLKADCLSYIHYQGKPVKASRLFAGYEHEQQIKRIAAHFNVSSAKFKTIGFDARIIEKLKGKDKEATASSPQEQLARFDKRALSDFSSETEAYHQFMLDVVEAQRMSTELSIGTSKVKRLFVDGGFGKNVIYMNLLADVFPQIEVFAASMAQATAIGTALAIHQSWNSLPFPNDIIELKYYAPTNKTVTSSS